MIYNRGHGEVYLPDALSRKLPNAAKELRWQFLFPASRLSVDPRSGAVRRHHMHESSLQKQIKQAAANAQLVKRVSSLLYGITFIGEWLRYSDCSRVIGALRCFNDHDLYACFK